MAQIFADRGLHLSVRGFKSSCELDVTRRKLQVLEERCRLKSQEAVGDEHVRELSLRSLRRLINQLKEELVRSESRGARSSGGA